MTWTRVADIADCPAGASEHVVAGRMVALFHVDGEYYALDGVCPHQGGPLGQGAVETSSDTCFVTCPWHGWQFDVRNGAHRTSPLEQQSLPVKVEQDGIYVDLES